MMSAANVLKMIKDQDIQFVDFRFTDTKGKEQHVSVPAAMADEDMFDEGKMFDGSSIAGWKGIQESDMILMPDANSAVIDPFLQDTTLLLRCDVIEPTTMQGYDRDPRTIAKRGEAYLKSTGIGDAAYFGPEAEFFIFDSVRWSNDISGAAYEIESKEAAWSSDRDYEEGNIGHRPGVKGGYFPVPPVDAMQDVRSAMCLAMADMGLQVEVHHHEVGTAGQGEIGTRFDTLVAKADQLQVYKYCVHNVAHAHGLTATFMPKPLVGDNGSGMHVHQSIWKAGKPVFAGSSYADLSGTALHYIGGIIKHAKAINAFSNPATNSYKRLIPGFEAPVLLAYSARNRSAACRIPFSTSPNGKRVEVRFPDPAANPYLTFTAMLMAGLDGIANKIDPGDPMDKNLYDLPPEELQDVPTVCHSLREAVNELDVDREFLKKGDVFSDDLIDGYLELKWEEIHRFEHTPHPVEFAMYYSV